MKYITTILFILISSILFSKQITETVDTYKLTIKLKVPVIVDNMQSLGKRVFKQQKLEGTLFIKYSDEYYYPVYEITNLINKSYQIGGVNVSYRCTVGNDLWWSKLNYVGNNKTTKFKTPTLVFFVEADPSYNIGLSVPDNTLLLVFSGKGTSKRISKYNANIPNLMRGYCSGQIGCGCYAYGHISPTRVGGMKGPILDRVEDISAVYGQWKIKFKSRSYRKVEVDGED